LRYGDYTINAKYSKGDDKKMTNIDEIMKMNENLKPFQERINNFKEDNFITQCSSIESKIYKLEKITEILRNKEEMINVSIKDMAVSIFEFFEKNYKEFSPDLKEKYKFLKDNIKLQKDENANLSKQLDLLKQDIKSTEEQIKKLKDRLLIIEKATGFDTTEDKNEMDKMVADSIHNKFMINK
jgi:hypothetical protein